MFACFDQVVALLTFNMHQVGKDQEDQQHEELQLDRLGHLPTSPTLHSSDHDS
jgi:hypothetical protein